MAEMKTPSQMRFQHYNIGGGRPPGRVNHHVRLTSTISPSSILLLLLLYTAPLFFGNGKANIGRKGRLQFTMDRTITQSSHQKPLCVILLLAIRRPTITVARTVIPEMTPINQGRILPLPLVSSGGACSVSVDILLDFRHRLCTGEMCVSQRQIRFLRLNCFDPTIQGWWKIKWRGTSGSGSSRYN